MRYLIRLSYMGTQYHGWQIQENAHSIQSELELKLSLLCGNRIELTGCGRTDKGVHAKVFYAHFDHPFELDTSKITYKANQMLPDDIAIHHIIKTPDDFHARFSASSRTYEYHINRIRDPFKINLSWYRYGDLDIPLMNLACKQLILHKDFECFSKVKTQVDHFLCDIHEADWTVQDDLLVFTIRANRFLRNMVRAIVGTLIEVGKHEITLDDFSAILNSRNRSEAGQSVPAYGLFLTQVEYPESFLNLM